MSHRVIKALLLGAILLALSACQVLIPSPKEGWIVCEPEMDCDAIICLPEIDCSKVFIGDLDE
jgi:hypothetical protein